MVAKLGITINFRTGCVARFCDEDGRMDRVV